MGVNQFTDLSDDEKENYFHGIRDEDKMSEEEFDRVFSAENQAKKHIVMDSTLPKTWDWRTKGAVHAIKNQKQCGSCWAFSTCFALESFGFITGLYKPNGLVGSLSEQYLVDCSMSRNGCDGGWPCSAINYADKDGIPCETCYTAYSASYHSCTVNKMTKLDLKGGYKGVAEFGWSTQQILAQLYKQPISICVYADKCFMSYRTGIFTGTSNGKQCACNTKKTINHAVGFVGWAFTSTGDDNEVEYSIDLGKHHHHGHRNHSHHHKHNKKDHKKKKHEHGGGNKTEGYWILRNSWGENWGEKGYMLVAMDGGEAGCGVACCRYGIAWPEKTT